MHQILQWKLWSFKYNETCETTSRISRNQSPPQSWSLSRTKSFCTHWWCFKEDKENARRCWCKLMSRFHCTLIAQGILNLVIHSTMYDVSSLKYMTLCCVSLEALYICVYAYNTYGRCWLMNERSETLQKFLIILMSTSKENSISDLQSEMDNGIVSLWGRTGCNRPLLRTSEPPRKGSGSLLHCRSPLLADTKGWGCAVAVFEVCLQQV